MLLPWVKIIGVMAAVWAVMFLIATWRTWRRERDAQLAVVMALIGTTPPAFVFVSEFFLKNMSY